MKYKVQMVIVLLFVVLAVHAQIVSDPIYTYIDRWETRGYLEPSYLLRPYSPEVIKKLLVSVIEKGTEDDARIAKEFLEQYSKFRFAPAVLHRSDVRVDGKTWNYRGETGARVDFTGNVASTIWINALLDILYIDGDKQVKPYTERPLLDIHDDGSMDFLPKGLSGDKGAILYGMSASTWFGPDWLWGSASYARSSVGPFFDNGVVLGPQAHAAPGWTLNGQFKSWRFSMAMYQLTTSNMNTDKYLAFHSYSFAPLPNLDLGLFESVVWHGGFKPLYAIPLSMMFYLQSTSGFKDNSLAGLYVKWRPIDSVGLKLTLYFDDVGFSDLIKFKFDTKIIGAAQIGVTWAPEPSWAQLFSFDYTAIFPYMYAHKYAGTAEDNYTSYGDSLGAALQPNSDRFEIRAKFAPPVEGLLVDGLIRFIRHGNASESVTSGDGSWFDDGWIASVPTYQRPFEPNTSPKYFRFLSQKVIEMRLQLGAGISWTTAVGKTRPTIAFRYTLEPVWNNNLVKGDHRVNNYFNFSASWSF